jgi:hypothetical protein
MAYKQETDTGNGDRGRRSHAFKRALLWVTALLVAVFHSRGGHDRAQRRDGDPALVRGLQLDR